jgi:hypothetical protein
VSPYCCHYCTDTLKQAVLHPVEVETPAFLIPNDPFDCTTFNRQEGARYPIQAVGRYRQCLACPVCIQSFKDGHVGIRVTAKPVNDS